MPESAIDWDAKSVWLTRCHPRFGLTILLVGLATMMPCPGAAQISGVLTDKGTGEPLNGVLAVLLDTQFQPVDSTVSGPDGHYHLRGAGPGLWHILVLQPGHLQHISNPIQVTEEGGVEVDLQLEFPTLEQASSRTDSLSAQVEALRLWLDAECAGSVGSPEHVMLMGFVTDSLTGVPMPGIPARILWSPEGTPFSITPGEEPGEEGRRVVPESRSSLTGPSGLFLFCDVPAETQIVLEVGLDWMNAEPVVLNLPRGSIHREDVAFPLSSQTEPGNILGEIRDADTGVPVEVAEVTIQGTDFVTLTNRLGHFSFRRVPYGIYVLEVEHLAYGHTEHPFRVVGGGAQEVNLELSMQAIPMDPLRVEVHSLGWFRDIEGVRHRQMMGFGTIITRDEIEVRGNPFRISDLVRGLPGVKVYDQGISSLVVIRNARRFRGGRIVPCPPTVYVDGKRYRLDPMLGFNDFPGGETQAVEVYSGSAMVPGEFRGVADEGCGAVVIWTRR